MDAVEVTRYDLKIAQQQSEANQFKYFYKCFSKETQKFETVVQTFSKFSPLYNWNKVDRIICGDEDKEMREGMRFKRLMFAILPDEFESTDKEDEYVSKFLRLQEYLNKLLDQEYSAEPLNIKIVQKADPDELEESGPIQSTPGIAGNSMQRFYVRYKKGKRDGIESIEVVVDTTFDTAWSFRMMFQWLVASTNKVEAQIQLLQRRCSQFGLGLVEFSQISVSKTLLLNPFRAPAMIPIRDVDQIEILDVEIDKLGFIHDGMFFTKVRPIVECVVSSNPTTSSHGRNKVERGGGGTTTTTARKEPDDFGRSMWSRSAAGRQYVKVTCRCEREGDRSCVC